MSIDTKQQGRRTFLKGAGMGALGAGLWSGIDLEAYPQNVNANSKPSDLRITDVRIAWLQRVPMSSPIIRIDTNQGIYGLGEVRDGAHKNYALELKSRILGMNPCNVDRIFRKIKQFGNTGRAGGGVSGIEVALWDLAGKAYNVPVYQMIGGKFRDRARIYCDTTESDDPKVFGQRLRDRVTAGFTWLKMDLNVTRAPGEATSPAGIQQQYAGLHMEHQFMATEVTEKGLAGVVDFVGQILDVLGMTVPLSMDHLGPLSTNSVIRVGKALTKLNISWMEDTIPWQETENLKKIADAVDIPICTGEDIYLHQPFEVLCREHAVDIIHPDLLTSGGILETKRIGDMAQEFDVPMALHCAHTPIGAMACAHVALATENFLVLENHAVDTPYWGDLVDGIDKPIVNRGYITPTEKPGLGLTLNEEACKQHMMQGEGWFEPTDQWNNNSSSDYTWS